MAGAGAGFTNTGLKLDFLVDRRCTRQSSLHPGSFYAKMVARR